VKGKKGGGRGKKGGASEREKGGRSWLDMSWGKKKRKRKAAESILLTRKKKEEKEAYLTANRLLPAPNWGKEGTMKALGELARSGKKRANQPPAPFVKDRRCRVSVGEKKRGREEDTGGPVLIPRWTPWKKKKKGPKATTFALSNSAEMGGKKGGRRTRPLPSTLHQEEKNRGGGPFRIPWPKAVKRRERSRKKKKEKDVLAVTSSITRKERKRVARQIFFRHPLKK